MHSTCLSRQDTLPTEDPSWSYSQVPGPGQPAPIPLRNEPVLYIPRANHTVDDSNVHTIAMCLKNLRTVKVHLPPANSESMNGHGTVTHAFNITNPDNSLGKVCIIDVVFTCWPYCPKSKDSDFFWPKPPSGLDDEALPLSAMAALAIHTSPKTSGIYK